MSKDDFLKYFQINTVEEIKKLVIDNWGFNQLLVVSENTNLEGIFKGFIDISIENLNNPKSIVAIEIEHKSSYSQANKNINKLKKWSHNSYYRKCGFLHLFNESCKITEGKMEELINAGKYIERQGKGFFYEYSFYNAGDKRETKQIPANLVNSKEFRTRLWKLISDSDLL